MIVVESASKQRGAPRRASSLTKGKADGRQDDETSCSTCHAGMRNGMRNLERTTPAFSFFFFFSSSSQTGQEQEECRMRGSAAMAFVNFLRKVNGGLIIVRVELPFSTRSSRNLVEERWEERRGEEKRRAIEEYQESISERERVFRSTRVS